MVMNIGEGAELNRIGVLTALQIISPQLMMERLHLNYSENSLFTRNPDITACVGRMLQCCILIYEKNCIK